MVGIAKALFSKLPKKVRDDFMARARAGAEEKLRRSPRFKEAFAKADQAKASSKKTLAIASGLKATPKPKRKRKTAGRRLLPEPKLNKPSLLGE